MRLRLPQSPTWPWPLSRRTAPRWSGPPPAMMAMMARHRATMCGTAPRPAPRQTGYPPFKPAMNRFPLQPAAGSTNFYRVRAFNLFGDSAYSNTNSARTPGSASGSLGSILIASNAVWNYLDNGSNQSNAWTALNFDERAWSNGPALLGYGSGKE